jgi:hypothetical protein
MDYPWYVRQYAKLSLLYTKTTGQSMPLLPVSPYVKPFRIPVHVYIKQSLALRRLFIVKGQYVSPSNEEVMQNDCIHFMTGLNWNLVAQEWTVIEDRSETGKGDLVFQKGDSYIVIECKRRTNTKVYNQSRYYASSWKLYYAPNPRQPVYYGIWTPRLQMIMGVLYSEDDAQRLCTRRVRYGMKKQEYLRDS